MNVRFSRAVILLFLSVFLLGCDQFYPERYNFQNAPRTPDTNDATEDTSPPPELAQVSPVTEDGPQELVWDDLIPADWRLDKLTEKYDLDNLSDDDPRAEQVYEELQAFWKESPVVYDHDGKLIKIPGFVVPLEFGADTVSEFLLVPYYGACIHSPPPPANQTVYVKTEEDKPFKGGMFDTVWVTGTLVVEKIDSTYGPAGYRINATTVAPYQ